MKIALISHLFPTELNPFHGKFIKDQLELFKNTSDFDLELLVPTPISLPLTERYKRNNCPLLTSLNAKRVKYLSFPNKQFPKLISRSISSKIVNALEHKNTDIIHVHWLYPDGLCIPSLKEMGHKTVLTIHGSDWYQSRQDPVLVKLLSSVLSHTDKVLYSGPKLKDDIEHIYPELASKSDVIYNMVNEALYKVPDDSQKKKSVKELGWDASKRNALTVASIREEKGVDLLVKAIRSNRKFEDINFHIVGSNRGDAFSDAFFHSISDAKNIFYHPPVSPVQLVEYYQAADFFILPSRREGFNVSILEAMSCGIPVICTNVGGNKEIITDQTGIIAQDISPESLQSAILNFLSKAEKFNPVSIHNKVEQRFGTQSFLKKLLDTYSSLSEPN